MQQRRHDDGTATGQYNFKYNNYNGNYGQNKLKTKELYEKQVSLGEKPSLFLCACAGLLLAPNLEKQVSNNSVVSYFSYLCTCLGPKKAKSKHNLPKLTKC